MNNDIFNKFSIFRLCNFYFYNPGFQGLNGAVAWQTLFVCLKILKMQTHSFRGFVFLLRPSFHIGNS